eukprot:CAMPEP_0173126978 /NCGR_PEP_ID=MMETSP1102-20130122/57501_1 /TAXON_ID=49646 /ORGANISM="Geminigera sp., Strain Caron Lab Isolate" /LENGTH=62 /DNA_ID=CAMNT_0014036475 /DNA_START=337 /DNA_END=522 /DNA_ORIENTATION=-
MNSSDTSTPSTSDTNIRPGYIASPVNVVTPVGSLRGPEMVKWSPPPSLSSRFDMTHVPSRVA